MHGLHNLLLWLVLFTGFMYLVAPLLIKFGQKMDPDVPFQPVDLGTLPPPAAQYLWACQQALEAEGFETIGHLSWTLMPKVFPLLTLFMDRKTQTKAMSVAMYTLDTDGAPLLKTRYVEFVTLYQDGRDLTTNNVDTLGSFKPGPLMETLRFPDIQDPHRLLALHCRRLERLGMAERKPLPAPGTELTYQQGRLREDYERQAEFGRLKLDPKTGKYVPTFVGAYLMTWGLLWPVKPIRQMLSRNKGRTARRDLEGSTFARRA